MQEFTKILILEMHKVLTKILKGATVWPLMVRGLSYNESGRQLHA